MLHQYPSERVQAGLNALDAAIAELRKAPQFPYIQLAIESLEGDRDLLVGLLPEESDDQQYDPNDARDLGFNR